MRANLIAGAVACLTAIGACSSLRAAYVDGQLQFEVWEQAGGSNWSALLWLHGSGDSNTVVTSSNGLYSAQMNSTSQTGLQGFSSLSDVIASLPSDWTVTIDAGLATQHSYSMTLNLGSLPCAQPIVVTYPVPHTTVTTLTPTFQFALPPDRTWYNFTLQHGGGVFDAQTAFLASTSSWTPSSPLLPNTEYYFDLDAVGSMPGFSFSAPTDSGGQQLGNWTSSAAVELESSMFFSTVPEPAALALFVPMGLLLARRRS